MQRAEQAGDGTSPIGRSIDDNWPYCFICAGKYEMCSPGCKTTAHQAGDGVEERDWLLMAMAGAVNSACADEAKKWLDKAEQIRQERAKKSKKPGRIASLNKHFAVKRRVRGEDRKALSESDEIA